MPNRVAMSVERVAGEREAPEANSLPLRVEHRDRATEADDIAIQDAVGLKLERLNATDEHPLNVVGVVGRGDQQFSDSAASGASSSARRASTGSPS